jgi:PAS domain-containing protein
MFELGAEEILALGWTKRIHPHDIARVQQSRANAIGPLNIYQIDYRIELPVAGTRWISAFSTALMTHGQFAGRIGIARDVTARIASVA